MWLSLDLSKNDNNNRNKSLKVSKFAKTKFCQALVIRLNVQSKRERERSQKMYVIEEATSGLLWTAVMLHHCEKKPKKKTSRAESVCSKLAHIVALCG